ncbi:MAG TPA: GAF domain-containing SpoIIE family protein phosphatase [Longimicrobiaceae bacterium]|nr:GAF domain-containing SpoIIE family protein phosphatase [Longimicrobiaceae bacterium]
MPHSVVEVLDDFSREHPRRQARLWVRAGKRWNLAYPRGAVGEAEPGPEAVEVPQEGQEREWRVEVLYGSAREKKSLTRFLARVLARARRHHREVRAMSTELSERYEEITLLYSISEILGSVISLDEAAATILAEVKSTLAADRAALWLHDPQRDELNLVAAVGGDGQRGPISVEDRNSLTAQVFRESRSVIFEPGDTFRREEEESPSPDRGDLLSVPVSYTPPSGSTRTIGVINLVRHSGDRFSAGDLKLVTAIASQVGAAIENNRLVRASLQQERLVREAELAHDLQMKLLPEVAHFAGEAEVAARCLPAHSVGGDFYQLFRLSGGRLGVVMGDVSSHGFAAALIMALTMSAVAIHASEGDPPAEVLRRVHRTLIGELTSTEMFVTLFYGVVDPRQGRLTYANAGHPHAFRISAAGEEERLPATNPPLGIVDLDSYSEACAEWKAKEDLLFLFTDGLPRALAAGERHGEQQLVEEVVRLRALPVCELLERLFSLEATDDAPAADDRTALLVRL